MAETTTITRPAPIIEGSLTAFLKSIDKLGAGAVPSSFAGIDTSKFAPKIAAESQLQQDARTCLLYTSPSPRDGLLSRMPSSA